MGGLTGLGRGAEDQLIVLPRRPLGGYEHGGFGLDAGQQKKARLDLTFVDVD